MPRITAYCILAIAAMYCLRFLRKRGYISSIGTAMVNYDPYAATLDSEAMLQSMEHEEGDHS